ncbi:MAG: HAD-IC family P-type ATPase, partial [Chloroflexota bacterium]
MTITAAVPAGGKPAGPVRMPAPDANGWRAMPTAELASALQSGGAGLDEGEAARRLAEGGPNSLAVVSRRSELAEFASLLIDPLVLILLGACVVSAALGEPVNAAIIAVIVASNVLLNAVQLHRSRRAVDALRARVALSATVVRGGRERAIPVLEIVPGDVVRLAAGNVVPADGRLLESRDLNLDESMLTGESVPAARSADSGNVSDANVYLGSSVLTGAGAMLAAATGRATDYGAIAASLAQRAPETAFERGIRQFAALIMRLVFALILGVVLVNLVLKRDPLESFLFGIALATGLTPELLPMVTSVTLARGAVRMAHEQVIVKRLPAIQNLGSMDTLCSDKTGTLTAGAARTDAATDPLGNPAPGVLALAATNSALQAGIAGPLDAAILEAGAPLPFSRIDELPFDASRRMLSVIAAEPGGAVTLIAKGAPEQVLAACDSWVAGETVRRLEPADAARIAATADRFSAEGRRTLAVATGRLPAGRRYGHADESALVLQGFVTFLD